jgi:hypothetical protein
METCASCLNEPDPESYVECLFCKKILCNDCKLTSLEACDKCYILGIVYTYIIISLSFAIYAIINVK